MSGSTVVPFSQCVLGLLDSCSCRCSDVGRQGGRDGEKPKVISQQSKPVFLKDFSFLTVKRKYHFNTSFPKSPSKRREHRKSFSKGGQELFGFIIILGEKLLWLKALAFGVLWKIHFRSLSIEGGMFRPTRHISR